MQFLSGLSKKQFFLLISLFILLVAIPLTLYLARQSQIFKGRATTLAPSSVAFVGLSGNPPTTSSQNVELKLAYNPNYGINTTPSISSPVTSGPSLSVSPTQVAAGGKVTVNWTGVNSDPNDPQEKWIIATELTQSSLLTNIGNCADTSSSNFNSYVKPPSAGSCTIAGRDGTYTYKLYHYSKNFAGPKLVATSNQVTSGPSLSVSPTQVAAGGNVTVSWTGVNAAAVGVSPDGWYIRDDKNLGDFVNLNNCSTQASATATQAPSALAVTFTATPATVNRGDDITLSWSGLNATDSNWVIWQSVGGNYTYINNCWSIPNTSQVPASGSCKYKTSADNYYPNLNNPKQITFYLVHLNGPGGGWDSNPKTSSPVTVIDPTPTPVPYTPPAPTPEPAPVQNCGIFGCCSVWNPLACL